MSSNFEQLIDKAFNKIESEERLELENISDLPNSTSLKYIKSTSNYDVTKGSDLKNKNINDRFLTFDVLTQRWCLVDKYMSLNNISDSSSNIQVKTHIFDLFTRRFYGKVVDEVIYLDASSLKFDKDTVSYNNSQSWTKGDAKKFTYTFDNEQFHLNDDRQWIKDVTPAPASAEPAQPAAPGAAAAVVAAAEAAPGAQAVAEPEAAAAAQASAEPAQPAAVNGTQPKAAAKPETGGKRIRKPRKAV